MSSLTDQMGFNFRPPERRLWKVRDLVAAVRSHIEREYSDAWVEGEISNFRSPDSGHLYFTLKDGNAQIRVVMFRSAARLLRFRPADGMQVVVRGRITVYEDRGGIRRAQGRRFVAVGLRTAQSQTCGRRTVCGGAQEGDSIAASAHRRSHVGASGGIARYSKRAPAPPSFRECTHLSGSGTRRLGCAGGGGRGAFL